MNGNKISNGNDRERLKEKSLFFNVTTVGWQIATTE